VPGHGTTAGVLGDTGVRAELVRVVHEGLRDPAELVAPLGLRDVFAPAEMRHCGGHAGVERWAGRLAAKRAVLAALGNPRLPLSQLEIVPQAARCFSPARCARGHRPVVRPGGAAASLLLHDMPVQLSISHTARAAVAVVVVP